MLESHHGTILLILLTDRIDQSIKIQCKEMASFCRTIIGVPSPDVLTRSMPFFFFFKFDRLGVKLSMLMISP
jgi:hypothetical protein